MKKYYFLIVLALILGLVLTGCSLLSNISQVPTTEQSGVTYLTKGGVPPSFDLIGLWHFDTDANDSTANHNNGTFMDNAYLTTGYFGNAVSFDGSGDYVEVSGTDSLEPSNVTVECWVKSSTIKSYQYIVAKYYTGSYASYGLYTGSSKGLFFYVSDGSYSLSNDAGTGVWDGEWHHIAGTYDGSILKLYVDGIEVGTGKAVTKTIGYNTGNLYVGSYGTGYYFTGTIDEVRIWDGALTGSNIEYNYSLRNIGIDIKPGSDPNSINLGSNGVVPVAILGSADFDASTVNPSTITLAGAGVKFKGNSGNSGSLKDVNGDGYPDLVVQVYTENLELATGDGKAVLSAYTYAGPALTGSDSIRIVPTE